MSDSDWKTLFKIIIYFASGIFIFVFGIGITLFIIVQILNYWPLILLLLLSAQLVDFLKDKNAIQEEAKVKREKEQNINGRDSHSTKSKSYRSNSASNYRTYEDDQYESIPREETTNYLQAQNDYEEARQSENEAWEETRTYDPD